jgi:ZIP family zinc transporter
VSVGLGLAIGATLLVGALVASFWALPGRPTAVVSAFGGGVLLAGVAFELLPDADARAGRWFTSAGFLGGVAVYVVADAWLTREKHVAAVRRSSHAAATGRPIALPAELAEKTRGESMAAGLFLDGVPESFALGLTIAERATSLTLLVGILIGNVVEAYGSAQPILVGRGSKRFAVGLLGGIGLLLGGSTVVGATVLADASDWFLGTAQAGAAGAVLAVVTVAIVPHVFAEVNRMVAAAMAIGFVVGYLLA